MSISSNKLTIINMAFRHLGSLYLSRNPMYLFVLMLSFLSLIIFSKQIFYQTEKILLYGQITFWLWMTLFFSSFIESLAIAKNPSFKASKIFYKKKILSVKKLDSLINLNIYTKINRNRIKAGNLILLENGNEVPFDGEVVHGKCYVNESNITGVLTPQLKSFNGDNLLITGTIIQSNDLIVMKVSFARKKSFFTKLGKLLEEINRQAMPSEIALQRLILGLAILFIAVIANIWIIADYFNLKIPYIYFIALAVILMPTTISGLHRSIIYNGQAKLASKGITVHDQIAFDNAVDINIVLIDKTGTLTMGQREMVEFKPIVKLNENDYFKYLYLSSIDDDTIEGQSIISFILKNTKNFKRPEQNKTYQYLPFSSSNPISGCNYNGIEIRKGSLKAVAKYLGVNVKSIPNAIHKSVAQMAKACGTPVIFTVNREIVGIINLRDKFRQNIISQIKNIQDTGLKLAMVTGDNFLTASSISFKLGINSFYADQTPEKKLNLVRSLQRKGYIVAMCGDGINDALALAGADIGYTFENEGQVHATLSGNIVSKYYDLNGLVKLKKLCQKIILQRGALTIYSISSDLAKYFVIVPSLFTTAFPILNELNIMQFKSLEGVILASVIFNALTIPCLAPFIFAEKKIQKLPSLWWSILLYGFGGIISPFIFIKLIEFTINKMGLI